MRVPKIGIYLSAIILAIGASGEVVHKAETFTTPGGWSYDLAEMPDTTGWAVSIIIPTNDLFDENLIGPLDIGSLALLYSGMEGVSTTDKAVALDRLMSKMFVNFNGFDYQINIYLQNGEEETAIPLFSDSFNKVEFDSNTLESVKKFRVDEITEFLKQPRGQIAWALSTTVNDDSGLEHIMTPRLATEVNNVRLENVEAWYSSLAKMGGLSIAVAGPAHSEKLDQLIDQLLVKFSPDAIKEEIPIPERELPNKLIVIEKPDVVNAEFQFAIALPADKTLDDRLFLTTLSAALFGENSNFGQAIKNEMNSEVNFSYLVDFFHDDASIIEISIASEIAAQTQVYQKIIDILDKMVSEQVSEAAFRTAQDDLKSIFEIIFQDQRMLSSSLATWNASDINEHTGVFEAVDKYLDPSFDYKVFDEAIRKKLQNGYEYVAVIVTPEAGTLPADCVVKDASEVESCDL